MPLTEEQKSAVEVLKTVAAEDIDEAAEALKSSAHPVYQKIFGGGHSAATQKAKADKAALETQLNEAREAVTTATTELDELKKKTPDRAQIDSEWQKKLDREIKAREDKLAAAEAKVARLTTDTTAEKVENALLAAGFRPRIAKLLAKEGAGRITYGDDGQPVLYEPGTQIPVQIPAGKSAFEVLAEAEKTAADPADLASNADSGGGVNGGSAGSGYDPVKAGKEMAAAQKATAGEESLAFR